MHTQGPWQIDTENAGGGFNIRAACGARVAHTMEVAKYADGGPIWPAQAKANAELIEAAPELFEILREIEDSDSPVKLPGTLAARISHVVNRLR